MTKKTQTNDKDGIEKRAADTGKSVHLSASAGSGKTRALKDRYLALLDELDRNNLGIDQAVAITFTDKAAAEIKERVMKDLPEAMLKKIVRGRQDLRISTIHSFCMNLLKRYPLEAGLPPDFGVLDARDQAYKMEKAIEDALEESDRDPEVMGPLRDFTADDLISTVEFLLSMRSRLKRMEIDAGGPEPLLSSVRAGMGIEQAQAELNAIITSAEWRTTLRQMELLLRSQGNFYEECKGSGHSALAAAKDIHAAYRIVELVIPLYFTQKDEPRKKLPISRTNFHVSKTFRYPAYETLYSQIQEVLSRLLSAYRRAQAGREALSILRLYLRAEERYQESKVREGLLDFDDLEVYAYRLLRSTESPDILYWLDRKILHFLVDEFQDTSDIQWAILEKLTEEIFAGQGADKPAPPTLFVVGDEKQSIYRFREANYRLLENVRKKMERLLPSGSREILTLHKNFRSTPEIIGTVNRVFTALWGKTYQPSEEDRTQHTGSARLIELLPSSSGEVASIPTEAEILAREIKKVVDGRTIVYEKNGEQWKTRAAGYGDCTVLIQSRTRLKEYEAALQKEGIPYRVVGGIGFYEEDEIQALLNVLFFLWNRDDRLALAAALKSPLFGLTDHDIFDLMQDGGNMAEDLKRRRPDTGRLLNSWMGIAGLIPLSGLIHRIVRDTGAYVRFGRRNPQAIFNIDKLLDTAREFDRRGYTTLQDFVVWVKNIRESEQREATADMNLPGFRGAVSVMTVHKAKGLEFPVVFLPGMNQQPKSVSAGPLAVIESDGKVRMAVKDNKGRGGFETRPYDEMWQREQEELRREHQRLLYVAITRTRDHLVMIGTLAEGKTPVKQNTWLDYLYRPIPSLREKNGETPPRIITYAHPRWIPEVVPIEALAGQQPSPPKEKSEVEFDIETVIRNLSPVPASETLEWKKATDFIAEDKERSIEDLFLRGEGRPPSPLVRGRVLHRCLEEFTRHGAYNMEGILKESPELQTHAADMQQQFKDDVGSVLKTVLNNKDLAWIFERRPDSYSELPFLYKRGRDLVSGVIDRVVVRDGKGFVIDYKAILIENDEALTSWKDHYRPQIRIYCEAVKELFRLQSVEGYLLFLDSSRLELIACV